MVKEFLTIKSKETTIKVAGNEVNAIRTKDLTKKGVRVYEDGKIGISGCIGNLDEETLVSQAQDNLKTNISYPYELTKNIKDHRTYSAKSYTPVELKDLTENLLDLLKKEYSEFLFSHMIKYTDERVTLTNDEGMDLEQTSNVFDIALIIKEKSSANLMDGFIGYGGRNFDYERFVAFNRRYLDAYKVKAEIPEGDKIPVVFISPSLFMAFFSDNFNGEKYGSGSSLYNGKLGEQLFGERVTITYNQNPDITGDLFFDMEGKVLENDKLEIVKEGKFINVLADKKTANDYSLPHTGGAKGSYDSRPSLSYFMPMFEPEEGSLKDALKGQDAVMVIMSSGGDFTPDGSYAAPVQVALRFDGENFIGKVDEFSISSHIDKMLGEDYIGTFKAPELYFEDELRLTACYMKIKK